MDNIGNVAFPSGAAPRVGAFGEVWKGFDLSDAGAPVAVKLINVQRDSMLSKASFDREYKILRQLDHPNIVRIRDAGITDDRTPYFVFDWVERSLKDLLSARRFDSWRVFDSGIVTPIVDALAHAHTRGVEHRDIKPANILITDDDQPMLADFGTARAQSSSGVSSRTMAEWGSWPYIPPEGVDGRLQFVRDVYAIAVVIVECLAADPCTDRNSTLSALQHIDVPPDVRNVLRQCLASTPDERPRNASALSSELRAIDGRERRLRARKRNPLLVALTAKARDRLSTAGDWKAAEAAFLSDFEGPMFAHYFQDFESGELQRDDVMLISDGRQYHLKLLPNGAARIVGVKDDFSPERLEFLRGHAWEIPPILEWVFGGVDRDHSAAAWARFIDGLEKFYDRQEDKASASAGDERFDVWARILTAREDLARSGWNPIPVRSHEVRGKEIHVESSAPLTRELVGQSWQLRDRLARRPFAAGEAVSQSESAVTLFGGRWFAGAQDCELVIDIGSEQVVLRRQRDALTAVRDGKSVSKLLANLVIDPERNPEPSSVEVEDWTENLDSNKQQAVCRALGADDGVFLVQGPPGTGKTRLIAEFVTQFLRLNPGARVLVASQTNVAVDNALERITDVSDVQVVRVASGDTSRVSQAVKPMLLERQVANWAKSVAKRADENLAENARSRGLEAKHLRAILKLRELQVVLERIDAVGLQIAEAVQGPRGDQTSELVEHANVLELQQQLDRLTEQAVGLEEEARQLIAGDLTLSAGMGPSEVESAIGALTGDDADLNAQLSRIRIQAEWMQRLASDEGMESLFLSSADVVAGTCVGFIRRDAVKLLEFDLCIVDEASRATVTETLIPIARAKQWVLVGDTNQLPPMDEDLIRDTELMAEHGLEPADVQETLFQRFAAKLPSHSQIMLSEQYRMSRPIGDLISSCFYDGRLKSMREVELAGWGQLIGKPVVWVDTSGLGTNRRESYARGSRSPSNREEARQVVRKLKSLARARQRGFLGPADEREDLEVLVIAPYTSQVRELEQQVARMAHELGQLAVSVTSVDQVQGREADIAIVSLTRSNERGELGFLGPAYARRINVALSRSRYGLIIVGDADFIRGISGALKSVLRHIEQHPNDCLLTRADK